MVTQANKPSAMTIIRPPHRSNEERSVYFKKCEYSIRDSAIFACKQPLLHILMSIIVAFSINIFVYPTVTYAGDGEHISTKHYKNGGWHEVWDYADKHATVILVYGKDGYLKTMYVITSNPNPEDGTGEKGNGASKIHMALQNSAIKGIIPGKIEGEEIWKTPFGKHLTATGHGSKLGPKYNPSDDGDGSGSGALSLGHGGNLLGGFKPSKYFPGSSGGFSFRPNGGSFSGQFTGYGKKHGDQSDNGDGNQPPGYMNPFPADLPAPPEIVNPSWGSRELPKGILTVQAKQRLLTNQSMNRQPVSNQHLTVRTQQNPAVVAPVKLNVATVPSVVATRSVKVRLQAATPGRLSAARLRLRK